MIEIANLTEIFCRNKEMDFARPIMEIHPNTTHVVGFEFDGFASFRKGAKNAPDAIRETTYQTETYSPSLDREVDPEKYIDLGNLVGAPESWEKATKAFSELISSIDLEKNSVRFFTIGGDHSISYASISEYLKQYPDLVLIHLDAHADLREEYEGTKFSHASIIKRAMDFFEKDHRLIQFGIRSGMKEEFDLMREKKTLVNSLDELLDVIDSIPNQTPIYLTLDIDFFDPSIISGTGTPEIGGEDFKSFSKIICKLADKKLVGADMVELAPELDASGVSTIAATTIFRELLLAF